jgi:peptidoglycan/xylan/chitin deacetylase (PgdA/CDA1 family)
LLLVKESKKVSLQGIFMGMQSLYRKCIILLLVSFLLSSCSSNLAAPTRVMAEHEITATQRPSITAIPATQTATAIPQPTQTATEITPQPTHTPSLTPSPTWVFNESGQVIAPILLYHYVDGETSTSRYQVSVSDFRAQMETLHNLGYTSITISTLLNALLEGAELPEKPVVITFDDGHESVYENAFPIMNEFGFSGVFYIVANRIDDVTDFVNVEQLKAMIAAGWEIGSHGYTHADVTLHHEAVGLEIGQSKADLERELSTKVQTFAYPFGKIDPFVAGKVIDYGYRAGMGLGISTTHTPNTLYYLDRREVYGTFSVDDFTALLGQD